MIKLCKWGCGCHMHIFKLNPLHCSGIVHIVLNSGILRCRKLIMNISSKPKTWIKFQANVQMTITIHIKYLEITVINQNCIHNIYKLGKIYYHSVLYLLSSHVQPNNIKVKINKTVVLQFVCYLKLAL
jgi:hypothetical protein